MRDNKFTRQMALFNRLMALGFTLEECQALRRIEMTLQRWAEQGCGDGNDYASWRIERDEATGRPYRCVYPHQGNATRTLIPDREAGALHRAQKIVTARNERYRALGGDWTNKVVMYHQTDPRGCALYLVPASVIPQDCSLSSCYTNGIAVAA